MYVGKENGATTMLRNSEVRFSWYNIPIKGENIPQSISNGHTMVQPLFVEPPFVEPQLIEPLFVERRLIEPPFVEPPLIERFFDRTSINRMID
jgi:hypothetical protein